MSSTAVTDDKRSSWQMDDFSACYDDLGMQMLEDAAEPRSRAKPRTGPKVVAGHPDPSAWLQADGGCLPTSLCSPAETVWRQQGSNGDRNWIPSGSSPDLRGGSDRAQTPSGAGGSSRPSPGRRHSVDSEGAEAVLIVDDCALFRENLEAVLSFNGIRVSGLAWDLPSVVLACNAAENGLVLLNMSTMAGDLLLRAVTDLVTGERVIVFGISEEDEASIVACAEAGVAGYHMRSDSLADLIVLIRNVADGHFFCPPPVSAVLLRRLSTLASTPLAQRRDLALTVREDQILRMLELGHSNRDIANYLEIAVHTVKNHVHNLLGKLGVSSRAEAAALSRAMRTDRDAGRD